MRIRSKFATALTALAITAGTAAIAQQNTQNPPPLTPDQIEEIRRLLNEQQAAEVNTPEEIEALRQTLRDAEAARAAPGYTNDSRVNLIARRLEVNAFGPGEPFQVQSVTLSDGMVTSLAFFDERGVAWPVESVAFDRERISVNNDGCQAGSGQSLRELGNIVILSPCAFWVNTNAQVLLRGETRPITFEISSGTRDAVITADGMVTVAVRSDAPRPLGRDVAGNISNNWAEPSSRAIRIDPIEVANGRVNPIVIAPGITTDLSFMDGSRNPWPIAEVSYAPGVVAVNGACEPEEAGLRQIQMDEDVSTIYVTACQSARATIAVRLEGRAGAISLLALPAQQRARQPDGTLSITVPGVSPITPQVTAAGAGVAGRPGVSQGSFTHDRYLDDFLFGTPPQGARRATVSGAGDFAAEAWIFNGALYIRGAFRVINPAYDAGSQTSDGSVFIWKYGPPVSRILANDLSGRELVLNISY